jgi:aldehyde:ferredoxin oxidoreductase
MHILRIDMANLSYRYEEMPESDLLLGGRALTAKIVHDEVPPTAHPLGPHNKLVLANGVLTGSMASSTDRTSLGAKSPLTGGTKESNAGGIAGLKLGRLGIRAIIFEGIRDDFQVIRIHKDGVEFEPAHDLLNQTISEAAEKLRARYGDHVGLYMIGVAGERKMLTAGVTNMDKDKSPTRFYGRGGLGAVAGAKGIKALILDDTGVERNKPRDPERFRAALKQYNQWLMESPGTSKMFPELGTMAMLDTTQRLGALPTRNFSTGQFENHEAINAQALRETILARGGEGTPTHACMPGCMIRCSNVYPDQEGKRVTSPIEYENVSLLGSNLGIGDLDAIVELNRWCNEYGVDTIETGAAIGVAMEAGVIPFGDHEGALRLMHELGQGTPLGRIIGAGAEMVGKIYGIRKVPVVKGQAMPAYEPRGLKGLGVTYATSPQGADHTAGHTGSAKVNHHKAEGQVEASKAAQISATIFDVLGICTFASGAVAGRYDLLADLVSGYIGQEVSAEDILNLAKETLRIEHAFNRGAGMTKAHDRLPEHFYEEVNPASQTVFDVPDEEMATIGIEGNLA